MPGSAVLALVLALAAPDTALEPAVRAPAGPVAGVLAVAAHTPDDTVRRRRKSIEVSEWYERRLRIHRYGSYLVYPLFAAQVIAGNQIFKDPGVAPTWAKTTHRAGATGLALVFTSNTVTGLWNLWDSRAVEQGRTKRVLHALCMLTSDAGFTYAGARLSEQAETSESKRQQHRNLAYASMATALTGIAIMEFWNQE